MARLIITRPDHDARATADRLAGSGHGAVLAPLMEVHVVPGSPLDLTGVQALLLTSANGTRAFAERQGAVRPELQVLCVGDATARAAKAAGLAKVDSAGGDVDDLADLVAARLSPKDGALLHVAGTKVAGDLAGMLERHGFTYRREVLYDARPVDALPVSAHQALSSGDADGVLLYSPRTAGLFHDLVAKAGLEESLAGMVAYCLSPNVAARCGQNWGGIETAAIPTEEALLDLLPASEAGC